MSLQKALVSVALSALFLAPSSSWANGSGTPGPRPIAEVERRAVELALGYLDQGPEAWWQALDDEAPLRRLSHGEALRELEVRAGAREGAHWTLRSLPSDITDKGLVAFSVDYASGLDETLFLQLAPDGEGSWSLRNVKIRSEPATPQPLGTAVTEAPEPTAAPPAGTRFVAPPWIFALAFLLSGLAAAALTRKRRPLAVGLCALGIAGATITFLMAGALGGLGESDGADEVEAEAPFSPRLATLLPLRQALTSREGATHREPVTRIDDPSTEAVARLWQAHHALIVGGQPLDLLEQDLEGMTDPARYPSVDLLRARIGLLRATDPAATAFYYERAAQDPRTHDGVLIEAAQALFVFGLDLQAEKILEQAVALGSRDANTYYSRQALALYRGQLEEAEKAFLQGWQLAPVERQDLFASPLFGALMGNQEILSRLQLSSTEEPIGEYETLASRALTAPAGATAELTAERLRFVLPEGDSGDPDDASILEVFEGSELAPFETRLVGASNWRVREEKRALAELARLGEAGRAPGAFALPGLARRISTATEALARQNRWSDLVTLTDGVTTQLERAPTLLVRLRAVALQRLDRKDEARTLLLSLAKKIAATHRREPAVLFQLADHFADAGDYDLAMRFDRKANSQMPPLFANTQRLDRFRMDKRLASSYQQHRSPHFELRFPPDRAPFLAERLAGVLEEERLRMERWIPVGNTSVTEVHLIPFDDFMEAFGRSIEIIGLFDGRIRLPMADLSLLNREIVSIISHELAHAMIAEATDDHAPYWLQEGLAQHAEMRMTSANPMPAYAAASGTLSLSALESILRGFPHPKLVAQAYDQACWTVHFIEDKHGRRAIHRLLAAFREGKTTEQALESVFGRSMAEFDQALSTWWLNDAPRTWETEFRDYRLFERQLIRRGSRRSPRSHEKSR